MDWTKVLGQFVLFSYFSCFLTKYARFYPGPSPDQCCIHVASATSYISTLFGRGEGRGSVQNLLLVTVSQGLLTMIVACVAIVSFPTSVGGARKREGEKSGKKPTIFDTNLSSLLIDGLLTNQNAPLLPVRGRTGSGSMFGIRGRRFLSCLTPPSSRSPVPGLREVPTSAHDRSLALLLLSERGTFSSPEATILLVSTKNHDLWP